VIDLVRRLGREGKTVVVSSHILYEVEAMTRRVLLVHNGRILAEGDVREIRDLLDEHPHTVALPRARAAQAGGAVVCWPAVLSVRLDPAGEWVTVETTRPDEFYGALHDAALEGGCRRDALARREPRVRLPLPGGAMRDTTRPLPFAAAARGVFDLTLDGMVFSAPQPADGAAGRGAGRLRRALSRAGGDARPGAARPRRPLRADGGRLLDPQRAAARGALLRDLARGRRGRGQDAHVPADAPAHARGDLRGQVRRLRRDDLHAGAAGGRGHVLHPDDGPFRAAARHGARRPAARPRRDAADARRLRRALSGSWACCSSGP
jgi:hypothetical protein